MPGRTFVLGAIFTVTAIVVGAGTVANLVMPPLGQDRAAATALPGETVKPIAAAPATEPAKRPTNGAATEGSSGRAKAADARAAEARAAEAKAAEAKAAEAKAAEAKAASAPSIAPQPEKPATARLGVNEAAAPTKKVEVPASQQPATPPSANSSFPPMQPLEAPATAAAPKPVQQATQPPSPTAPAAGPAGERSAAKKRVADDRRPKPSVRPEPYAMRDFLRSHW